MKKYLLIALALVSGTAFADVLPQNRSTFISGVTSTACISQARLLDQVVVGVTTSAGVLVIYDSSWTVSGQTVISSITLAAGNSPYFNNLNVKGICYQAVTPTNGVTILYKR